MWYKGNGFTTFCSIFLFGAMEDRLHILVPLTFRCELGTESAVLTEAMDSTSGLAMNLPG